MLINPIKTGKIADNIYAVRTFISNFYVIGTGNEYAVFDTGISLALSNNGLKELGIKPELVSRVFLTHSDYDHVGGLELFKNTKVYLSKKEEPMVTGKKPRLLIKYNKKLSGYHALEDNEIVKAENRTIQIISTPGHTPGSACYLIDGKILVTGDTLRTADNGRVTPFLFFQNMNHTEDKNSLNRLIEDGIIERAELILTGHTGILKRV